MSNSLKLSLAALAALTALTVAAPDARADKPIQLSLFTPVQIFNESETITGFRFSLFYGRQANFNGFDLSPFVNHVTGNLEGVQWGLANIVKGNALGWQAGLINLAYGNFKGVQTGGFNYAGSLKGLQWGVVNYAKTVEKGLQLGLLNIIERDGWLPFMILVNGRF